nr:hypothetical protein [Tanacetum cinerariifolium]
MTGNRYQLINFVSKFLGFVRFKNDQISMIMRYGDYQLGNVVISRKNTCFIRDLEGVDLISGSRDTNLYTISLDDMLKSSSICLLSKASMTKSWLWNRRLSHLNFGKSKKSSHQPKAEDTTNQEKLYLFHMDLCGPMRVASINGKKVYLSDSRRLLKIYIDIGIFVGYAPKKKAFKIYNRRTRIISETIHVTFDELTAMDSEEFNLGPGLHVMTPAKPSARLVSNHGSQQPFQKAAAPRAEVLADSYVLISISQDAPSTCIPSSQAQEHSPIISQGSSSNVIQIHTPFEHLGRWTKDHPIANMIGDPSRSVSIRKQLETDAMWCYFDAFLNSIEPKNFKQVMTEPSLIDAMQEEIHEF